MPGVWGGAWWSESRSFRGHHPPPRPAPGSALLGVQWTGKETQALPSGPASPRGAVRGPPGWGEVAPIGMCAVMGERGQGRLAQVRKRRKCPGTVSLVAPEPAPGLELGGRGGGECHTGRQVKSLEDRAEELAGTSCLHLDLRALGLGPSSAPLGGDGHASREGWVHISAKSLLWPRPPAGEGGGRPHWNGQEPELAGPRSRSRKGWL